MLVEPEPVVILDEPIVNSSTEPNIEISLRRSQPIRRPTISYDYIYLHENDFKIGQSKHSNSLPTLCLILTVTIGL